MERNDFSSRGRHGLSQLDRAGHRLARGLVVGEPLFEGVRFRHGQLGGDVAERQQVKVVVFVHLSRAPTNSVPNFASAS